MRFFVVEHSHEGILVIVKQKGDPDDGEEMQRERALHHPRQSHHVHVHEVENNSALDGGGGAKDPLLVVAMAFAELFLDLALPAASVSVRVVHDFGSHHPAETAVLFNSRDAGSVSLDEDDGAMVSAAALERLGIHSSHLLDAVHSLSKDGEEEEELPDSNDAHMDARESASSVGAAAAAGPGVRAEDVVVAAASLPQQRGTQ